jgi:hypothetical protein
MSRNSVFGKVLRIVGIVLMGITAAFTLMGGAGTTCVALAAEKFGERMAPLVPYKWLYITFVLVTLAVGVMGIRAVILLIKGRPNAYRFTVNTLALGILVGVVHMTVSRSLRGSSMPVDAVFYLTLLTLVVFLVFRIPAIWQVVDFEKPSPDKNLPRNAAAITLLFSCLLTLTVQVWAGPTHMFDGVNYADAWHTQLTLLGWALGLLGMLLLFASPLKKLVRKFPISQQEMDRTTIGF